MDASPTGHRTMADPEGTPDPWLWEDPALYERFFERFKSDPRVAGVFTTAAAAPAPLPATHVGTQDTMTDLVTILTKGIIAAAQPAAPVRPVSAAPTSTGTAAPAIDPVQARKRKLWGLDG